MIYTINTIILTLKGRVKMLLHYSFSNYCSYMGKAEFDMTATRTKAKNRFKDNYTVLPCGENVLKTAVIVGENAGGKSNFINSLEFMKRLFSDNKKVGAALQFINRNQGLTREKAEPEKTVQEFEIEILAEDQCIYRYHLKIDWIGILEESLYYKEKENRSYNQVFSTIRESSKTKNNNTVLSYQAKIPNAPKDLQQVIKNMLGGENSMGLHLTKLALLNIEHTIPFVTWMNEKLYTESPIANYDIVKSMKTEDDDLRIIKDERFLDIFRMVDYSICGIDVDEEKPFLKTQVIRQKSDGTTYSREILMDSSGVRAFFAWALQIFRVVYEDKVVFADEMDGVLNPILADRVIAFIHGKDHRGQFIFTSHNVLHLNLNTFMKEQIYFSTKNKETLDSQLYSLADFPEIRYDHAKIYEFYLKGILGGTAFE